MTISPMRTAEPANGRAASCFFFFSSRRRHTRFDCDWSSDVCSSDLCALCAQRAAFAIACFYDDRHARQRQQIGRASCKGKSVDLGGRRIIKKKKYKSLVNRDSENTRMSGRHASVVNRTRLAEGATDS